MTLKNQRLLVTAITAAISLSHVQPILAVSTTATEVIQSLATSVTANDIHAAKHLLATLRDLGVCNLRIGKQHFDIDTLINRLRSPEGRTIFVELQHLVQIIPAAYVWPERWASHANLKAPASPPDLFGMSSSGCAV